MQRGPPVRGLGVDIRALGKQQLGNVFPSLYYRLNQQCPTGRTRFPDVDIRTLGQQLLNYRLVSLFYRRKQRTVIRRVGTCAQSQQCEDKNNQLAGSFHNLFSLIR